MRRNPAGTGRPGAGRCGLASRANELKIVATGGLGDQLLLSPFVRHFCRSGRFDRILLALPSAGVQLFDRSPHIDGLIRCEGEEILLWALPERGSEVFAPYVRVQAPAGFRPGDRLDATPAMGLSQGRGTAVRQIARRHGIPLADEGLEVFTDPEDAEWAAEALRPYRPRAVVIVSHRTPLPEKSYPRTCWQSVVDALRRRVTVLELSSTGPVLEGTRVLSPLPPLRRAAELFRRADLVLTVDSFPGHLAAAVGTRAVVLFGPSNPETFGHPSHVNIRSTACPVCASSPRLAACRDRRCMGEIPPERVVEEALALLSAPSGYPGRGEP